MGIFKNIFSSGRDKQPGKSPDFSEGDIFYTYFNNQYHVYKLLVFDRDIECYHVLSYKGIDTLPSIENIDSLEVYIYHSPVDKNGFQGAVFMENGPVTADDLIGYHEYLRQTQDAAYYVPVANEYYNTGLRLTDEKKYTEAIDAYSKAIDLFPEFFEAIDNRAFCKMDLGLWSDAIEDFEASLEVNPGSLLAEFSIGECYLRLGDYKKSKMQFEKAVVIDPDHQLSKDFLKKVNDLIAAS